jgi:hypothetical protein
MPKDPNYPEQKKKSNPKKPGFIPEFTFKGTKEAPAPKVQKPLETQQEPGTKNQPRNKLGLGS